jgi:hypothetical protein
LIDDRVLIGQQSARSMNGCFKNLTVNANETMAAFHESEILDSDAASRVYR